MTITKDTTFEQLRIELRKLGVSICQISIMPDGSRRCDVADSGFVRAYGEGIDEWTAVNNALEGLARAFLERDLVTRQQQASAVSPKR